MDVFFRHRRRHTRTEAQSAEGEAASFEVAASACAFTHVAHQIFDDKLTFTAALVRAGEVRAATRLLQEVEDDVNLERVAFAEVVNEVRVRSAAPGRRPRPAARSMVAACLIAGSLSASAIALVASGVLH